MKLLIGFLIPLLIGAGILIYRMIKSRGIEEEYADEEDKTEKKPKEKKGGLSDGVQIGLTGLMVGLLLILAFRENFFDIFGKETPSWLKLAVIFIIVRSIWFFIAPLGQKPTFEPIRNAANFLYIAAFLIVIPAMIFGWDGKLDSLKFWGNQNQLAITSEQSQKDNFPGVEIVSSDKPAEAVNLCPQWTKVPPHKEVCLVDLPKNQSGLKWRILIQTEGTIYLDDTNLNKFPFSGTTVRRVTAEGGKVCVYGNEKDTSLVKVKIL